MVLVDSSVWIEAARKEGLLECKVGLEGLLEEYEAALTSPVRLEVLGGARAADRRKLESYLSLLPYFPVEEMDWRQAIRHGWSLRDAGLTIPWNDILVATVALRFGFRVYAVDAHFDSLARALGFELYKAGPGGRFSRRAAGR